MDNEKGRVLGLAHLGIAVADSEEARTAWEALGLRVSQTDIVDTEGVRTTHLPLTGGAGGGGDGSGGGDTKAGEAEIELLEPTNKESPVAAFLAKRGPGIHHLALWVGDIEAALARVRAAGIQVIGEAPRPGAGGTKVAFLHPKAMGGVLVELVEGSE